MTINKVELKDAGNKGIIVSFQGERQINNQLSAKRDNKMTEHLPLPIPLRLQFHRLKYFFLTMMGIWRDIWTEYLLEDYSGFIDIDDLSFDDVSEEQKEVLKNQAASYIMVADTCFSKTKINAYEVEGTSIKIYGTYEAIEGKPFKPGLPFISEDDDYVFHTEAIDIMAEISDDVMQYIKQEDIKLEDVKGMLSRLLKSEEDMDRIENQNDEENFLELMHKLKDQAIVIPLAGSELEKKLESHDDVKPEIVSKKTVDKENFHTPESQSSEHKMTPKDTGGQELGETDIENKE